eukprot:TRINITY_DN15984_c0_g1_i1.p1 TRINITY_DN15984_c0_g1~~TRINITY_DN15984_c0_g1_i1.p1  ORF type:complete len:50 (+),score=8.28 TRINITY_DN15984_c0_g1_i1:106-255(+)
MMDIIKFVQTNKKFAGKDPRSKEFWVFENVLFYQKPPPEIYVTNNATKI